MKLEKVIVKDFFTNDGIALLEPKYDYDLDEYYDLLLVVSQDIYIIFANVQYMEYEDNFYDYYDNQDDETIVFLYDEQLKFSHRPSKEEIIKGLI